MKNIKLTALSVTLIMLLIRLMSFFRDMILADRFGTSIENDVFIASQSIINIFAGFYDVVNDERIFTSCIRLLLQFG